ncbi:MAG: HEAT repeat domain-containing protein [Deltaproteobacteria bacterium]|nr:HEAT repeat domain-containing protein [Deltaproteobacteria bacterium]
MKLRSLNRRTGWPVFQVNNRDSLHNPCLKKKLAVWGVLFITALYIIFVSSKLANAFLKQDLIDRALDAVAMTKSDLSIRSDLYDNPFALPHFKTWMENPVQAPAVVQQKANMLLSSANKPHIWLKSLSELADLDACSPIPLKRFSGYRLPRYIEKPVASAIGLILDAVYTAGIRLSDLKDGVSPEKKHLFEKYFYPVLDGNKEPGEESTDPERIEELKEAVFASGNVDRRSVLQAGLTVVEAVEEAKKLLTETAHWQKDVESFSFDTPLGRVVVGGTGPDLYERSAVLIIDLGGDDLYRGKVASGMDGTCSVVIDLDGNDTYLGEDCTQACGFWGVGVLFDLGGNDVYKARNLSQGAGLFGLGLLVDQEGTDVYIGKKFVQAASAWGWGGLIDMDGEDIYQCHNSGQAFSEILGVSCLCDLGGNDKYLAGTQSPDPREPDMNKSFSQGFAIGLRNLAAGGMAILADKWGNDLYQCGYFGQGAAYWMGAGILYDEAGKDTFMARRYAQGAGIHFAFGLLVDVAGNDHTVSWGVSQGCGHDYGIGILVNGTGNDTYISDWLSMGASEYNGIGIFSDNLGDDGYETRSGMAVGRLVEERRSGGIGLFMDAGGQDRYSNRGSDSSLWGSNRWAVGVDADAGGISGLKLSSPEADFSVNPEAAKEKTREQRRLARWMADAEAMPFSERIQTLLSVASHWGFETETPKKAQEELLEFSPEDSMPAMVDLLTTPRILSLIFMDKFFSVHGFYASRALIEKSFSTDPHVKSRALYFLGRLKDTRGVNPCIEALKHPSWRVKSQAIRAIGEILNKQRLEVLIPMNAAIYRARAENDLSCIQEYLKHDNNARMTLGVIVRSIPMDYQSYSYFEQVLAGKEKEKTIALFSRFVFDHSMEIITLLEGWISAIKGSDEIFERLISYLDNPDPAVRKAAAYALGQLKSRGALPRLIGLLKDSDLWVRDAAALSVARFGEDAFLQLEQAMKGETPAFIILSLDVFSRIGGEPARKLIEKHRHHENENVRRFAGQILSDFRR